MREINMTTKKGIKNWINKGLKKKAKYMIVVYDNFSDEDYPIFCKDANEYRKKYEEHHNKAMERVMEVYDLSLDLYIQIDKTIAWYPPAKMR